MKAQNFFWFLNKPTDERENEIYNLAYSRAFKFIMLALAVIFILSAKADLNFPTYLIFFVTFLLLVVTHVIGWATLKNEDLSDEDESIPGKKPLWLLYVIPGVLIIYGIAVMFLFSEFDSIIKLLVLGFGLMQLLLIEYSFVLTKKMPLYVRLILSVLYPLFAIFLVTSKNYNKSKIKAILESIGYNVILAIISIVLVFGARMFVFTPFYNATDYFEPELKKGEYMIVNRIFKEFYAGEYVVYKNQENRFVIGRIKSVSDNTLNLETTAGDISVEDGQVLGKIFRKTGAPQKK